MSLLTQLADAVESDIGKDILPVLLADAQTIEANPDLILNPLTQPAEFAKLFGDVSGALPALEKDTLADALRIVVAYFQMKAAIAQKVVAARVAKPA